MDLERSDRTVSGVHELGPVADDALAKSRELRA